MHIIEWQRYNIIIYAHEKFIWASQSGPLEKKLHNFYSRMQSMAWWKLNLNCIRSYYIPNINNVSRCSGGSGAFVTSTVTVSSTVTVTVRLKVNVTVVERRERGAERDKEGEREGRKGGEGGERERESSHNRIIIISKVKKRVLPSYKFLLHYSTIIC